MSLVWTRLYTLQGACICNMFQLHILFPFSSPEAAILLVRTVNRDLWPVPIIEHARKILSLIFSHLHLSDLTMSPWIADFLCWEGPEVSILSANQKDRGLWGREWFSSVYVYLLWFCPTHKLLARYSVILSATSLCELRTTDIIQLN